MSLATLNVILSASTSKFAAGMAKGKAALGGFVASVGSAQTVVASLAGALGVGLSAHALHAMVKGTMQAIDATAKMSDRLGVTTEAMTGLQHAGALAGVSNEQLATGLEKMLRSIGDAATKGGQTAAAFQAIGQDARNLADVAPDEAFRRIADSIKRIQNPAQRTAATLQIFGKSGGALLPLMLSGAEGIAAAQKEAEKLGKTFSRVEAANVEEANDAMQRAGDVLEGVKRRLAIELAPFIKYAADRFVEMGTSGEGMGVKVTRAMESVAVSLAKVADLTDKIIAGWHFLGAAGAKGLGFTASPFEKFFDEMNAAAGGKVFEQNPLGGLTDAFDATALDKWQKMKEGWSSDSAAKVRKFFDEIRAGAKALEVTPNVITPLPEALDKAAEKAQERIKGMVAALELQAATFGKSTGEAKAYEAAMLGASFAQVNAITSLGAQIDDMKRWADATAEAKRVLEGIATPQEKLAKGMEKLDDLFSRGLLTAEQFDRAAAKLRKDAFGKFDMPTAPAAVSRNVVGNQRASTGAMSSGIDRLVKEEQNQGRTQNRIAAVLERIERREPIGIFDIN